MLPNLFMADEYLGYRCRPNLFVKYPGEIPFRVLTNVGGFRVTSHGAVPSDPSVVFIGDSQVFGLGLEADDTFPVLISRQLDRPIVNAGVPGYGLLSMSRMLERCAPLAPDVFVVGHSYVHLHLAAQACYPGAMPGCLQVPHFMHDDPGPETPAKIREPDYEHNVALLKIYASGPQEGPPNERRSTTTQQKFDMADCLYGHMQKHASAVGAKIVVVYLPKYDELTPVPEHLQTVLETRGIPLIDLTCLLHRIPTFLLYDGHLNAEAQHLVCDALMPHLRRP